jgi:hypothetical protein
MEGFTDREDLIRDHWRRYGFHWDISKMPRLRIPVRHKLYPYVPSESDDLAATAPVLDKLEFSFERGSLDGRPAYRITCDGIVVEEGPL